MIDNRDYQWGGRSPPLLNCPDVRLIILKAHTFIEKRVLRYNSRKIVLDLRRMIVFVKIHAFFQVPLKIFLFTL
eukprot:UN22671